MAASLLPYFIDAPIRPIRDVLAVIPFLSSSFATSAATKRAFSSSSAGALDRSCSPNFFQSSAVGTAFFVPCVSGVGYPWSLRTSLGKGLSARDNPGTIRVRNVVQMVNAMKYLRVFAVFLLWRVFIAWLLLAACLLIAVSMLRSREICIGRASKPQRGADRCGQTTTGSRAERNITR